MKLFGFLNDLPTAVLGVKIGVGRGKQLGSHCNSSGRNNHCCFWELVVIVKVEMSGSK